MSTIDKGGIPVGYEKVSALEALEKYGPERVFEAADKASSRVDDFEGANEERKLRGQGRNCWKKRF